MRGPPQPTHLLLLLALHCTQCTLRVRGATQPVMRMDKSATGGTFPYNPFYDACEQDDPLGMISGAITDAQISTSSYIEEGGWAISKCAPTNARPFLANGLAWCPKYKSSTEWLQIDLGVRATVRLALNVVIPADDIGSTLSAARVARTVAGVDSLDLFY
ncbi:hypothetical protein EGR_00171 [Echinococcus granulosus]|uniref:F5/8 type C domain-containing protein n=1 Tax=Echinococcus granulosus TaxID=6210 RepID=W6V1S2_ECHGR|nr:hypothetical protein EGR_00171 [Echinococcus granulosus]EUB64902.1 hypothetical protein EGR_00171 [Echinococcus granulosus]